MENASMNIIDKNFKNYMLLIFKLSNNHFMRNRYFKSKHPTSLTF